MATRATSAKPRNARIAPPRASKALAVRPEIRERFQAVVKRAERRAIEEEAAQTARTRADRQGDEPRGWRARSSPVKRTMPVVQRRAG